MVINNNIELARRILKLDGKKVTISNLKNLSVEVRSEGLNKTIPILDKKFKKALDQCGISGSKKVKVELSTELQQQINSYIRSANSKNGDVGHTTKKKVQQQLIPRCNSGSSKPLKDYGTKLQKPTKNSSKSKIKKKPLNGIDAVNSHFNTELNKFKNGERKGNFSLGYPGKKLIKAGFAKLHIWLKQPTLAVKLKQHNIDINDIRSLPKNLNSPIMIFDSANVKSSKVILVENKRNMVVAIHLKEHKKAIDIYDVASIHIREDSQIIAWAEKGLLRYADKKKAQKWLIGSRCNSGKSKLLMDCIAKLQKPSQKQKGKSPLNGAPRTGLNFSDELFTRADQQVQLENMFTLPGEIGSFLGNQQRYRLAIALLGDKHTGKSEFKNQLINAFLKAGLTVGHFDLEHGGLLSKDTQESMDRNIPLENRNNLAVTGEAPNYLETVKAYANKFDVVVIDSWQKLNEFNNLSFDSLRIEHPNTIWVVVFQLNSSGGTRGGNSTEFNAPVVLKAQRMDKDFNNNYVEIDKNRGNRIDLIYKIVDKKVLPLEVTSEIKV